MGGRGRPHDSAREPFKRHRNPQIKSFELSIYFAKRLAHIISRPKDHRVCQKSKSAHCGKGKGRYTREKREARQKARST